MLVHGIILEGPTNASKKELHIAEEIKMHCTEGISKPFSISCWSTDVGGRQDLVRCRNGACTERDSPFSSLLTEAPCTHQARSLMFVD